MTKTSHVKDPEEYFDPMTRDDVEVQSASFVKKAQWKYAEEFVEPSGRTNVILAAYTTCHARPLA